MEFGTGCLKLPTLVMILMIIKSKKYNIEILNILNKDATVNENVDRKYIWFEYSYCKR